MHEGVVSRGSGTMQIKFQNSPDYLKLASASVTIESAWPKFTRAVVRCLYGLTHNQASLSAHCLEAMQNWYASDRTTVLYLDGERGQRVSV